MTAYTADAGEVAVCGRTLAAGVEDVVDLNGAALWVEVTYWPNSGTDPIYIRVNSGSTAAALPAGDGGSACYEMQPGDRLKFDTPGPESRVRLICAGVAKYSVSEA